MKKRSSIRLFIILVFALPVTAYAMVSFYEKRLERLPVFGPSGIKDGKRIYHHIDDFSLVNQDGQAVTTATWNDKIVVANFFFTHCPSICPKMTANLSKINNRFKGETAIRFNSFSVDPERDSINQLKRYASRFGIDKKQWDLLTGDKKEIYKLARNSFMIVATDGDGGPVDFIHSEKLVLVDKQKRIRGYYDGTSDKETNQLIQDIIKLEHEN